jgi:hypothetical protein
MSPKRIPTVGDWYVIPMQQISTITTGDYVEWYMTEIHSVCKSQEEATVLAALLKSDVAVLDDFIALGPVTKDARFYIHEDTLFTLLLDPAGCTEYTSSFDWSMFHHAKEVT